VASRFAVRSAHAAGHVERNDMITTPRHAQSHQVASVRLTTGPRLQYVEHGDPGGEPIVLLHGYTDSSCSYSRLWPLLDPRRYRTFALDQRGHGDSDRPLTGYTLDDFAADVVAFLGAVGIGRATIVGHSMGSLIARRVALTYPDRVGRLVLIGAILGANELVGALRAAVQDLVDPVPEQFVRAFQQSTLHTAVPEAFLDRVVQESLKLPARAWQRVLDGIFAAPDVDRLGQIAAPTLLVWGEHDAFFSREEQEHLAAAIPGARLTVYPETGHAPHWERPERVAHDIVSFLRETAPAQQSAAMRISSEETRSRLGRPGEEP
jgi:pimeloyl-ACP methyl ester carboxylesterase